MPQGLFTTKDVLTGQSLGDYSGWMEMADPHGWSPAFQAAIDTGGWKTAFEWMDANGNMWCVIGSPQCAGSSANDALSDVLYNAKIVPPRHNQRVPSLVATLEIQSFCEIFISYGKI